MSSHRTTVRIPASCLRELDSDRARAWIAEYLQSPVPLPPDPGPGDARADLAIPRPTLRALIRITREPVSASLRRLFALNLGVPRVETQVWTTPQPVEQELESAVAPSRKLGDQIPGHDPAPDSSLGFQWIVEKFGRHNSSPRDTAVTVRPAPTRPADPWLEEFVRFHRSDNEEAKMQLAAADPPADPDRWRKVGLVIFVAVVALVALLIWLAVKSRGRPLGGRACALASICTVDAARSVVARKNLALGNPQNARARSGKASG